MSYSQKDTEAKEQLRQWLAKKLNVKEVPEPLWNRLEEGELVEEALYSDRTGGKEDLLSLAREHLKFVEEMAPFVDGGHSSTSSERIPKVGSPAERNRRTLDKASDSPIYGPEIDPLAEIVAAYAEEFSEAGRNIKDFVPPERMHLIHELLRRREETLENKKALRDDPMVQRAKAFSLYLAKLAEEEPEVKRIRNAVWDDGVPPPAAEAKRIIYSPATAVFSTEWFLEKDVPIANHRAEVTELHRDPRLGAPRIKGKVTLEWDEIPGDDFTQMPHTLFQGFAMNSEPFDREMIGSERIRTLHGSFLSELLEVSEHLESKFPWEPSPSDPLAVPMFVLTGQTPPVSSIKVSLPQGYVNDYEQVHISVWPWVPVEEVASFYERARKELEPKPNTSNRRLALLSFVLQHPGVKIPKEGEYPQTPPWRELQGLWNEKYPDDAGWHYTDIRNFQRDFRQAYAQVVKYYRSERLLVRRRSHSSSGQSSADPDEALEEYETVSDW